MPQGPWERPWHLRGYWFSSGGTFCKTVICFITALQDNLRCPSSGFWASLSHITPTSLDSREFARCTHSHRVFSVCCFLFSYNRYYFSAGCTAACATTKSRAPLCATSPPIICRTSTTRCKKSPRGRELNSTKLPSSALWI